MVDAVESKLKITSTTTAGASEPNAGTMVRGANGAETATERNHVPMRLRRVPRVTERPIQRPMTPEMQCSKCDRHFFGLTGGSCLCSLCLAAATEKRIHKPRPDGGDNSTQSE